MCIYGSIKVQHFAYLLIIIYDYTVMHLNFRGNYTQIRSIHAYRSLYISFTLPYQIHQIQGPNTKTGLFKKLNTNTKDSNTKRKYKYVFDPIPVLDTRYQHTCIS